MHFGLDDYNTYLWLNAENDEYDALEREMAIHLNVSSSSIDRNCEFEWNQPIQWMEVESNWMSTLYIMSIANKRIKLTIYNLVRQ